MRLAVIRSACLVPTVALCAVALSAVAGCGASWARPPDHDARDATRAFQCEEPFVVRRFEVTDGSRWIGNGVAYGPFRDGQFPGGPSPSRAELEQDLELMSRHWSLLRLYGAVGAAETVVELIRENDLDMRVMLGAWIDAEELRDENGVVVETRPEARAANRREIDTLVRLANAYPGIVVAVNVGNETQVSWSSHRVPPELVIDLVREVRARTGVPVSVADDSSFWIEPESRIVAREIDFVVTHIHPLWRGLQLDDARAWTEQMYARVAAAHPDRAIVIGETGWATGKRDEGEQARLIKGQVGEEQQRVFHDALTGWAARERITTFFFEAFDENWKGGEHPDEVEKHWGLFRADRSPKRALTDGTRHRR